LSQELVANIELTGVLLVIDIERFDGMHTIDIIPIVLVGFVFATVVGRLVLRYIRVRSTSMLTP
jgi:hypothetical protein